MDYFKHFLSKQSVSRATRYRLIKKGHRRFIPAFIEWREDTLYNRPWSENYKRNQLIYLIKYLEFNEKVQYQAVIDWLSAVPSIQASKRRDMYASIAGFSKYLNHIGELKQEELTKLLGLYPRKNPYYQPKQRIIYQEELTRLIPEASRVHNKYQALLNSTLLIFLSETALRVSEACALHPEHLHFSENPSKAFVKVICGKGGKNRLVPFSRKAQEVIRKYLENRPSVEYQKLFIAFNPKHGYTPLNSDCVRRRFHILSKNTGIPFSAHSLRHYRITLWANNPRIPITVTQKWAGHSSLEVTQRYIHIRDEDALMAAFE